MPSLRAIPGGFAGTRAVPGQMTTDVAVMPNAEALRAIAAIATARVSKAADFAAEVSQNRGTPGDEEARIIAEIRDRKSMLEGEQARLRSLFRWLDNLYFPDTITEGGPDHWPLTAEARRSNKTHVSVNTPPVYVDVPAALQAVPPVENYVSAGPDQDERDAAGRRERLYFQWKEEVQFELEVHKSCVLKELYGHTWGKVYWDEDKGHPTVRVIDSPENLYAGWGDSDFARLDWTIYCYGISPESARTEYGVGVQGIESGDSFYPYVTKGTHADPIGTVWKDDQLRAQRPRSAYEMMQVEVYDYWYKKPGKGKKPQIWNAIYVGNALVENAQHKEYDELPYVLLPNTYIPGSPYGRPALYDIAQLIREKDERISEAAAMIHQVTGGQMWQIVGQEAPDSISDNMIPKANKVSTPGPGNEIKAIQPFMPEFAVEAYIKRLDQEMEAVSGLNELLLGRAPATILGSSKAIAALVANYEARIRMRRDLLYQWRRNIWTMVAKVWEAKDASVKKIIDGNYRLDIKAPELTPRDELEVATKALNLVGQRVWSMERAMDATGVEDPGEEKAVIRMEQTDPALNPQAVTQQATLFGTFQSLGLTPNAPTQAQASNAARQLTPAVQGGQSMNAPENQGVPMQETLPANAQQGGPNAPNKAVLQTMVTGDAVKGRVLTQTKLGGG